jgi:transposase
MTAETIERIELDMKEVEALLARVRQEWGDKDYDQLRKLLDAYVYLTDLVADERTTIARLRELLGSKKSEKTAKVFEETAGEAPEEETGDKSAPPDTRRGSRRRKGHGRHGADAYEGAQRIDVAHASLEHGDRCPSCEQGKVYKQNQPGVIVRIRGRAPLAATVYELEKLRCHLCGEVFTARSPEGIGDKKYDAGSAAMIALLKYGSGLPFNRLAGLQGSLGIPLPASTQWEIVQEAAKTIEPAYGELIRQAAQGEVLHNDDTGMKVLELMPGAGKAAKSAAASEVSPDRTGVFTSGIVATQQGRQVALFFTGRRHAGENLRQVLLRRAAELGPPIQMCDALSRNLPAEFEVVLANCLAHGRRQFIKVVESFPDACRHVLEQLGEVYKNDATARARRLSDHERLRFHQQHSRPVMDELQEWLDGQLEDKKVEPNSGAGKAMRYMLRHWDKLTRFLHVPGAPLDNNVAERALKMVILHRKNALFFKTENGAHVGDIFMSLIHTCQLSGVNPFDYLTALLDNADRLDEQPQDWMPWSYRETFARADGQ